MSAKQERCWSWQTQRRGVWVEGTVFGGWTHRQLHTHVWWRRRRWKDTHDTSVTPRLTPFTLKQHFQCNMHRGNSQWMKKNKFRLVRRCMDKWFYLTEESDDIWYDASKRSEQTDVPECLESPRGSSLGSLETLGVAHPTANNQKITTVNSKGHFVICDLTVGNGQTAHHHQTGVNIDVGNPWCTGLYHRHQLFHSPGGGGGAGISVGPSSILKGSTRCFLFRWSFSIFFLFGSTEVVEATDASGKEMIWLIHPSNCWCLSKSFSLSNRTTSISIKPNILINFFVLFSNSYSIQWHTPL